MDRNGKPKLTGLKFAVVGLLIALPVLYVLSIGPAFRLLMRGRLDETTYIAIYRPITWVYDNVPPAKAVLLWYADLWTSDIQKSGE